MLGAADPRYVDHPEWAWFDPVTETDFPEAFGGHGTHVTGTLCGGAPGEAVGVAPGAQWIHAATIARGGIPEMASDTLAAFEWPIDPDGDPTTTWDVPAVCVNGWGLSDAHGYPPCDETFWAALDACEAAGIVIIFDTAFDLGPAGEDNAYGYGMIDCFEAVPTALEMGGTPGDADEDGDVDFQDVLLILSLCGPVDDCPPHIPADADQDCDVDFDDPLIALANWTAKSEPRFETTTPAVLRNRGRFPVLGAARDVARTAEATPGYPARNGIPCRGAGEERSTQ